MLRGSRPPVAGVWHMHIIPIIFFKNLNVNHWILVHFRAENGDILQRVPKYNVNEPSIYS